MINWGSHWNSRENFEIRESRLFQQMFILKSKNPVRAGKVKVYTKLWMDCLQNKSLSLNCISWIWLLYVLQAALFLNISLTSYFLSHSSILLNIRNTLYSYLLHSLLRIFLDFEYWKVILTNANTVQIITWLQKQPPKVFFIKKETLAQVFSGEFCEISKNTFFIEHLWWLLLLTLLNNSQSQSKVKSF